MDSVTLNSVPPDLADATQQPVSPIDSNQESGFQSLAEELFSCSDSSPKKLTEIIARDVALKAEVISLANAFIFTFGRPVRTLAQAIACLGYDRCRKLVAVKMGAEILEADAAEASSEVRSEQEPAQRLPGVRPYRKERLSSLYPPKNRGRRPHFLPAEQPRT